MFKTDKLEFKNGVWEININYDYPFNGKNHKQAVQNADKLNAMKLYRAHIHTLIELRMEDFLQTVSNEVAPKFQKTSEHYRIKIDRYFWVNRYWEFLEKYNYLKQKKGFDHNEYIKEIIASKDIFIHILPEYEALTGYKVKLINILDELMLLAKIALRSSKVIKEEYQATF